jgi:hypothetical protein
MNRIYEFLEEMSIGREKKEENISHSRLLETEGKSSLTSFHFFFIFVYVRMMLLAGLHEWGKSERDSGISLGLFFVFVCGWLPKYFPA